MLCGRCFLLYHTFTGHILFMKSFCCLLPVEFACKCDVRGERKRIVEKRRKKLKMKNFLCKFTNKCLCESCGLPLTPMNTVHASCMLLTPMSTMHVSCVLLTPMITFDSIWTWYQWFIILMFKLNANSSVCYTFPWWEISWYKLSLTFCVFYY